MSISVREGSTRDEDDVAELMAMGRALHCESPAWRDVGYDNDGVHARLVDLVDRQDRGRFWLAERDRETVGYAIGMQGEEFWAPLGEQTFGMDVSLYVSPKHRGTTAAKRLIRTMEEWSAGRGMQRMYLGTTTKINEARVRRFYERLGYRLASMTFSKDLPPAM